MNDADKNVVELLKIFATQGLKTELTACAIELNSIQGSMWRDCGSTADDPEGLSSIRVPSVSVRTYANRLRMVENLLRDIVSKL